MANPFENGPIVLREKPYIKTEPRLIRNEVIPFINDPKAWDQYHNETLYQAEVALREWMTEMSKDKKWAGYHRNRRYIFSQLFEILFGRPYENSDARYIRQLTDLFAYYSTKIQTGFWDRERQKTRSKTLYTLSPNRLHRPPYGLKLRMEYFAENGVTMTEGNMRLYGRDLRPGHARNPRTNAKMEKRSEQKREAMREYKERQRAACDRQD